MSTMMVYGKRLDARYFPLVLDSVGQGIFTVNAKGVITTFNKAAQEITGYKEHEVLGKRCRDVFQTELCETICPMRRSLEEREAVRDREVLIRTKDGRRVPIAVTTTPLETGTGKLLGGVEVFKDMSLVHQLQQQLTNRYRFEDIVSKNAEMQRIFRLLPLVAESNSTILITGESGTGKELIAKAIHSCGPRKQKPFVAINCAAMPETLLESELFGYKKGAFTDARQDKPGKIAAAQNGTLFLDEVADLTKPMQVKILRFLQERVYEPLGSNRTEQADVRVVAATNRDLRQMVRAGEFREDLFFRLNVMEIRLPPLRQRAEDIPLLAQHFVEHFAANGTKNIRGLTDEALSHLIRYPFPGNIRELENLIERAFIVCTSELITSKNLPVYIRQTQEDHPSAGGLGPDSVRHAERDVILSILRKHKGNRTHAAKELGIHRVTLVRKLKKYNIS